MNQETTDMLRHLPEKSREVIINFTDKLISSCADNLATVILFGSAAEGEYVEGKSDINILIVLEKVRSHDLNVIMETGKSFSKRGLAIPFVFEKTHIATSLDTFPIEFSDMKKRHILLYGNDPLENAQIEGKNLRYQCEREFKSILVNLRRGYLQTGGKQENIDKLLAGSLSSVLAACRGLIWLDGKTPSDNIEALLGEIQSIYGVDTAAIKRIWLLKKGHSGATATLEAILDDYAKAIAALAARVDIM